MTKFNSKKEDFLLDTNFPFKIFNSNKDKKTYDYLHYHDCLEINYVIDGSGVNFIDNTTYLMNKGDLYIINNLSHHMAISNGFLDMKIITFNPDFIFSNDIRDLEYLKPFYQNSIRDNNQIKLDGIYKEIALNLIKEIETEYNNKTAGYQLFIRSELMELLAIIYRCNKVNECSGILTKEQFEFEKIRDSIEYINNNYKQDIILEELASISNMSKNYYCTFFKKVMNMTTIQYIDLIRINKACLLLRTTSKSILEIAGECGYNSLSSFNSAFKKNTLTNPRNYRKGNI
ncbi:MAG: AraC family transcriptional regulator [Pleomorphochaeta sp.]